MFEAGATGLKAAASDPNVPAFRGLDIRQVIAVPMIAVIVHELADLFARRAILRHRPATRNAAHLDPRPVTAIRAPSRGP